MIMVVVLDMAGRQTKGRKNREETKMVMRDDAENRKRRIVLSPG
jgi:hypothetical protein